MSDDKTLELIKLIEEQKKEIAKIERPVRKTNGSFIRFAGCPPININVEQDIAVLIDVAAFLFAVQSNYDNVAQNLIKIDNPPEYKHQGFTLSDWIHDIDMRIKKLQINSKKDRLEKLEARLNNIISPELKAKMELESIEKELGL